MKHRNESVIFVNLCIISIRVNVIDFLSNKFQIAIAFQKQEKFLTLKN